MKKNVLQVLEAGLGELTEAQKKVADYILKNPTDAAFLTLDQIAGIVQTSTATVMRFAFQLGYSGYSEFQKDLQELLRNRVAPSIRLETNVKFGKADNLLFSCAEMQINNVKATVEYLSEELVTQVVDLLFAARNIYVVGLRLSHSVAHYLSQGLGRIMGNSELLVPDSDRLANRLLQLSADDVVILVSFPRYARRVVEIAQVVKKRAAKVIAITDGYHSPLAAHANIVLPCAFSSLGFHDSMLGAMFLADFLITAVALKDPDQTKKRLESMESITAELGYNVTGK